MDELKYISLDDDDVRHYLPDARILKYNELVKYKTIESLLPKHKSYVILLFPVTSETSGHWVALTRFNNTIEYSDSYGNRPDVPFTWRTCKFKNNKRYLSELLKKTKLEVVFNSIDFQNKKDDRTSTCGAFAVFRVLTMIEGDLNIEGNNELLKQLKKESSESYDNVVVKYINYR